MSILGLSIEDLSGKKPLAPAPSGDSPIKKDMKEVYVDPTDYHQNWYKQQPYGFIFTDRKGNKSRFWLPIAPSNLNIVTHFATNVISTMYGTVEEHSEQRYYDITISGTTGMSPQYYNVIEDQMNDNTQVVGRAGFPVKGGVQAAGALGGFFQRTQDLIKGAIGQITEVIKGPEEPTSGINAHRTGYVAFHNFYRWLLVYKKDVSGEKGQFAQRRSHPLQFVNFKDRNQYDVSINNFTLTRSAADPMLYNYNITMRAYNLRDVDSVITFADVQDRAQAVGLDGLDSPFFTKMSNKARQAKNAGYSVIGAIKGFGR